MPQLSAELFCQIIMGLHSDEENSDRHESRKEGRVGIRCSINVVANLCQDSGDSTMHVKVRDISPSGIGFVSHTRLDVGLVLECSLPKEDRTHVAITMVVRHCTQLSKGLYGVGASFDRTKILPAKKPDPAEAVAVPV